MFIIVRHFAIPPKTKSTLSNAGGQPRSADEARRRTTTPGKESIVCLNDTAWY